MSLPNNGRYCLKTLGCKANFYDSQLIEAELQKRGWLPGDDASLCIVNSCTVTDEADRQTRRLAAKLFRENPKARVVVTGCAAEVDPERLTQSKGIHYVVGNQNKPELVNLVLKTLEEQSVDSSILDSGQILGTVENYSQLLSRHPMDRDWPNPESSFNSAPLALQRAESEKTRSFLKIQEGCNSFCTFCIIPYARGPSRSLEPQLVLRQVKESVARGIREIVITGTNIGDYGSDWVGETHRPGQKLLELLKLILRETSLKRLRISSLDPTEIIPEMDDFMAKEPRFCPHFHVSLQSPHSRILKLMKRRYSFKEVKDCLERISKIPTFLGNSFIGMDLITGFPGETDDEFEWTYQILKELPWNRLHVFPYSERHGTPATRLPGAVPQKVRQERVRKLSQLSISRLTQTYRITLEISKKQNQALESVLIEGSVRGPDGSRNWLGGYTPNYLRVLIPMAQGLRNSLVQVQPLDLMVDTQAGDVAFVGRLISKRAS